MVGVCCINGGEKKRIQLLGDEKLKERDRFKDLDAERNITLK